MNNLTLGQYLPTNSWLHKVDPRIKLLNLVVLLVAIFLVPIRSSTLTPILSMLAILVLILILTASAKIPLTKVLNGLKPIVFLLTFTFVIQLFYTQSGTLLFEQEMFVSVTSIAAVFLFLTFYHLTKRYVKFRTIYFFIAVFMFFYLQTLLPYIGLTSYTMKVYDEGLIKAGFIFLRITNIIILTSLLTFTTMTTDLNYAIESLLKPLKLIKVPVEMIAMMLSLTLRYIPTLLIETEKIMKAQASRGVDFKENSFGEKIKQIISLLIPVFVISFKRSEDLANAMEVRGYVIGAKRTRIDEYHLATRDFFALIVTFLILAAMIYLKTIL